MFFFSTMFFSLDKRALTAKQPKLAVMLQNDLKVRFYCLLVTLHFYPSFLLTEFMVVRDSSRSHWPVLIILSEAFSRLSQVLPLGSKSRSSPLNQGGGVRWGTVGGGRLFAKLSLANSRPRSTFLPQLKCASLERKLRRRGLASDLTYDKVQRKSSGDLCSTSSS